MSRPAWWPSPREEALLHLALGLPLDPAVGRAAVLAALAAPSAEEERLFPLLHQRLALDAAPAAWHGDLPEAARRRLRRSWLEGRALRLLALRQAEHVLDLLHREGVPAAPLKGLAMDAWYGGRGRPIGDLDLLIPADRIGPAVRRLEAHGFARRDEADPAGARAKHSCALGRDGHAEVDLHWLLDVRLGGRRGGAAAMARYWGAARPVPWGDRTVLRLRAEHHFLHALVHGARVDSRARVRWIADAVEILRRDGPGFDWGEVLAAAGEARLTRWLAAALGRLAVLVPGAIPADVPARAAAEAAGPAERALWWLDAHQAPAGLPRDVQRTLRWHLARRRDLGLLRGLLAYPSHLWAAGLVTSLGGLVAHLRRRRAERREGRLS